MCLSPITIPNPSFRVHKRLVDMPLDESSFRVNRYIQDTTSRYIQVPCNHCSECRSVRQSQFVQRSLIQSRGYHAIMITLTYKNEMLPRLSLPFVNPETGVFDEVVFNYPDIRDVQNMFKLIRKYKCFDIDGERDFKYLLSSEYGGKKHRPHFHILLYLQKLPCDDVNSNCIDIRRLYLEQKVAAAIKKYWSRNIGSNKYPVRVPLCDYVKKGIHSSFQCEYVREKKSSGLFDASKAAVNDVSFYVTKYCLKFDSYENFLWKYLKSIYPYILKDDLYWNHSRDGLSCLNSEGRVPFSVYWNLLRPHTVTSKFFGYSDLSHVDYLVDCVDKSLKKGKSVPEFVNPYSGESFSLCSYYVHKILTPAQKFQFFDNLSDDLKANDYDLFSYKPIKAGSDEQLESKLSVSRGRSIRRRLNNRNSDFFVSSCSNPTALPDMPVYDIPFVYAPNEDWESSGDDTYFESFFYPDMPAELLDSSPVPPVYTQLSLFPDLAPDILCRTDIS